MEFENDAYPVDENRNGVRSKEKIKILLCAAVSDYGASIDRQRVQNGFYNAGVANYFEVSQAIDELIQKKALEVSAIGGAQLICANDTTRRIRDVLGQDISSYLKNSAREALKNG